MSSSVVGDEDVSKEISVLISSNVRNVDESESDDDVVRERCGLGADICDDGGLNESRYERSDDQGFDASF